MGIACDPAPRCLERQGVGPVSAPYTPREHQANTEVLEANDLAADNPHMPMPPSVALAAGVLALLPASWSFAAPVPDPATSPQWIAERFMDPRGFPQCERHYTGEMLEPSRPDKTLGQYVPASVPRRFRTVQLDSTRAVIAIGLRSANGANADYYAHFLCEAQQWKLQAVRRLFVPPFVETLADSLSRLESPPDSVTAVLDELRLLMASDDSLQAFAREHLRDLDSLVANFRSVRNPGVVLAADDANAGEDPGTSRLRERLRELHLCTIERNDEYPKLVFVAIGGILDNTAGFVWVPPGATPPPMSPNSYIVVVPISPGWFLFKTT